MLQNSPKCQGPRAMYIRPGSNMFSKRNHVLYHFLIMIHLHLASFYAQNTFKKKLGKMFIEQIIEFELRGPGPPGRACTPITG